MARGRLKTSQFRDAHRAVARAVVPAVTNGPAEARFRYKARARPQPFLVHVLAIGRPRLPCQAAVACLPLLDSAASGPPKL